MTMEIFENPDLLPLEELKLSVKTDGVIEVVSALNKRWVENRYFLHYESPKLHNADGSEIMGAKENWLEVVGYLTDDFKWLLGLPFYRFWSNVIFNTSILDALVSFLQEAPPFYALEDFPNAPDMREMLDTLRRHVLVIFARLVTNKESPSEYMSHAYLGNLLYDNYIFTVPIILDLCQLYGRENAKTVERILSSLFTLVPLYNNDLKQTIPKLTEALEYVEKRFDDSPGCNFGEAVSLTKKAPAKEEISLFQLEDLIIYVLDISSNITILLKNYPPAVKIFHREDFTSKIISVYENTMPLIYKRLNSLAYNDEHMPKYIELKHRLDVARVEFINLFRTILYGPILHILDNASKMSESEMKESVDDYINLLSNAISEQEFIRDYNEFYPVIYDLNILSNICPEGDAIKFDYMLRSLYATIGESTVPSTSFDSTSEAVPGPSSIEDSEPIASTSNATCSNNREPSPVQDSVKQASLISEVRDILCDLGEGFIEMCLKHYNYDTATVINAVLEDTLPPHLKEIDHQLPLLPPDPMEKSAEVDLALGIRRLNVFDNDEFDVMTRDSIDLSRVYNGKKKEKYKNLKEMLDDKSEVKRASQFYTKYSIIEDDYDDEYDDTYDSHDVCRPTQDDCLEAESRAFTTPRVLLSKQKSALVSEDESESEEDIAVTQQNGSKDLFLQNPADIRAKFAERRRSMRGGKTFNVVGKPKGQGQDKDVVASRDQKNTHKATRANHNRRSGAQWKRRQGMVPS